MAYLDLGELPEALDGSPLVASARRPAALWFRREDYLGDPARPLREEVLDAVEARAAADLRGRCACSPSCAPSGTRSIR